MGDGLLLSSESASLGYRPLSSGEDEWVLTKDGWITKIEEHEHDGLTKLFRLLRTKDIRKLEYVERPIGNAFQNAIIVSWLLSTIGIFLTPFYFMGLVAQSQCQCFSKPKPLQAGSW